MGYGLWLCVHGTQVLWTTVVSLSGVRDHSTVIPSPPHSGSSLLFPAASYRRISQNYQVRKRRRNNPTICVIIFRKHTTTFKKLVAHESINKTVCFLLCLTRRAAWVQRGRRAAGSSSGWKRSGSDEARCRPPRTLHMCSHEV